MTKRSPKSVSNRIRTAVADFEARDKLELLDRYFAAVVHKLLQRMEAIEAGELVQVEYEIGPDEVEYESADPTESSGPTEPSGPTDGEAA